MELIPSQIAALVGITLSVGITTATCYITGKANGIRLGLKRGHRDGYDTAIDRVEPDLHETTQRLNSAERILAATQTELRRVQDLRTRDRRNAAEAIEELTLRAQEAENAKTLAAEHATLLCQAANNLELAAATWDAMTATRKARDARTGALQLRELAVAIAPKQQEAAA